MHASSPTDGSHGNLLHASGDNALTHASGDNALTHASGDNALTHASGDNALTHASGVNALTHASGVNALTHANPEVHVCNFNTVIEKFSLGIAIADIILYGRQLLVTYLNLSINSK